MITQKVIDSIYKKYSKRPASPDELDIMLIFDHLLDHHDVEIDDNGNLIINSLPETSPFHRIALKRVHAIVEFEHSIAIVHHSSIIFLNKNDNRSYVHIRTPKMSFMDKLKAHMATATA